MINLDDKSQSYAHLLVFNKLVAKPRWPPKSQPKNIQTIAIATSEADEAISLSDFPPPSPPPSEGANWGDSGQF